MQAGASVDAHPDRRAAGANADRVRFFLLGAQYERGLGESDGALRLFTPFASSGGTGGALVGVYPNVLGGANLAANERPEAFAGASVGPRVFFTSSGPGGATEVELGFGVRLGLNPRLP